MARPNGPIRWRKSGFGTQSVPGSNSKSLQRGYCKIWRKMANGEARVVDRRLSATKALEVIRNWEQKGAPDYAAEF